MALAALLVLAGLSSYLVLPAVIEDQRARRLREGFGLPAEPDLEVSSSFPPELLLGRVDRIEVGADRVSLQGLALGDAWAELRGVNVSVAGLLRGDPRVEAQGCFFGWAMKRTGSLWPAYALHALNNLLVVVVVRS